MKVPYVNLPQQFTDERDEIMSAVEAVLVSGEYIGGGAIAEFEREAAAFLGVKHVIGLASGTDALLLGMEALGIKCGDEVITPPNSFVASTSAIVRLGARPVFADVLPDQNIDPASIERAITAKTRAIMPVHLTGRAAAMDEIRAIAAKHKLWIVEDAAQAIGSKFNGLMAGALGDIGCFSAHPLKNMNACGDAGFVATNHDHVAEKLRILRNIGQLDRNTVTEWGTVSRMDTLQAAILRVRLRNLPRVTERRRANAALYRNLIDARHVFMPPCRPQEFNTFHTFVVQVDRRDELREFLANEGIGTAIHYPAPIHLQPVARPLGYKAGDFPVTERQAGRILTLPVNQTLSREQIEAVAAAVNRFFAKAA